MYLVSSTHKDVQGTFTSHEHTLRIHLLTLHTENIPTDSTESQQVKTC